MKKSFNLRQWHIYAMLWLWVLLYPVIYQVLDSTSVFQWNGILDIWTNILPFFALFLVHNVVIIPRFPLPARTRGYLLAMGCLLVAFMLFQQYVQHPAPREGERPELPGDLPGRIPPHNAGKALPPPAVMERTFPRNNKLPMPPGEKKIPAFVMDAIIALLMMGCNLSVILLFQMWKEQEKAQQLEKANLQHELSYLKAQINPHFLMNMLNNIHSLIEADPKEAQDMVINFSNLMRYALYEGEQPSVLLSHEVTFISNYVQMMKQRSSNRKVEISLALPECVSDKLQVPPLLFIVFIENAFKHGISYKQASFVHISLEITPERRACFRCANSIPALAESEQTAGGIGLENVRKRIELLFGDDYTLETTNDGTIYNVTLNIPVYDEKHPMPGSGR